MVAAMMLSGGERRGGMSTAIDTRIGVIELQKGILISHGVGKLIGMHTRAEMGRRSGIRISEEIAKRTRTREKIALRRNSHTDIVKMTRPRTGGR